MVAVSGSGWKLAPSLVALIDETDERFPNRDHSSDGSIGDLSHQARTSDHNPDSGWVCAVDIDEDLSPTLHSIRYLWDVLIDRREHRLKYAIYEGQIVKGYVDSAGHKPWVPYPYSGSNPHDKHLHVSVWNTDAARNDTGPWWPGSEEDDMPSIEEMNEAAKAGKLDELAKRVRSLVQTGTLEEVDARTKATDSRLVDLEKKVDQIIAKLG